MTAYEARIALQDDHRMGYREVAGLIADARRDGSATVRGVTLAYVPSAGFTITLASS